MLLRLGMSRAAKSHECRTPVWDESALRARCEEPDGEPTQVIPLPLLRRLLAESTEDGAPRQSGEMRAAFAMDDPEFDAAYEQMLGR